MNINFKASSFLLYHHLEKGLGLEEMNLEPCKEEVAPSPIFKPLCYENLDYKRYTVSTIDWARASCW